MGMDKQQDMKMGANRFTYTVEQYDLIAWQHYIKNSNGEK